MTIYSFFSNVILYQSINFFNFHSKMKLYNGTDEYIGMVIIQNSIRKLLNYFQQYSFAMLNIFIIEN